MIPSERRTRLALLGATGIAVFALGVLAAMLRLPEWRNHSTPDQAFFATRFRQAALESGFALESAPHVELRSKGWVRDEETFGESETAYALLGTRAADWL